MKKQAKTTKKKKLVINEHNGNNGKLLNKTSKHRNGDAAIPFEW